MATVNDLDRLAAAAEREPDQLLSRWMNALVARSWTLGATPKRGGSSGVLSGDGSPLAVLRDRCQLFLGALGAAARAAPALEIGAPEFREPVQILAFTAGWMAGQKIPVGDALALVHSLEETLSLGLPRFFQGLAVAASEAYCAAAAQRAHARYRDAMEKTQLVCRPHRRLPCLFLVGDPDRQALDDAFGRLRMVALMGDAPVMVIDGSGLFDPEPMLRALLSRLREDESPRRAHVVLAGFPAGRLKDPLEGSSRLSMHETLETAFAEAVASSGVSWPKGT